MGILNEKESAWLLLAVHQILEAGYFQPRLISTGNSPPVKSDISRRASRMSKTVSVGDTVTVPAALGAVEVLPGYKPAKPMVFAGLYPWKGNDYPNYARLWIV